MNIQRILALIVLSPFLLFAGIIVLLATILRYACTGEWDSPLELPKEMERR